jgi:hypothetical protein
MSMKLGSARYGAQYTKKKYFKLKDGESVFRILPPMGDLADKGIWSVYHSVHYGYKNSEGKLRTFLSPLVINRTNKMIEAPDAALELIEKIKAQVEDAKKRGDKATADKLMEFAGGAKSRFNLDKNHYVNAMDLQGNIGVLKLRHKAKLALDATIKALRSQNIDPLSPEDGRFFTFRRTGNALDTTFQVEVYGEKINVPGIGEVTKQVVHKLTPDIIDRLEAEAVNLDKIFKKLTSEEVQQIVSSVDMKTGISKAVDTIFGSAPDQGPEGEDEEESNPYSAPTASQAAPAAAAPQASAPTATAAPVQAPVQQAATIQAPVQQAAPAAAAPVTTAQAVASTSDLAFLAELGVKI